MSYSILYKAAYHEDTLSNYYENQRKKVIGHSTSKWLISLMRNFSGLRKQKRKMHFHIRAILDGRKQD